MKKGKVQIHLKMAAWSVSFYPTSFRQYNFSQAIKVSDFYKYILLKIAIGTPLFVCIHKHFKPWTKKTNKDAVLVLSVTV